MARRSAGNPGRTSSDAAGGRGGEGPPEGVQVRLMGPAPLVESAAAAISAALPGFVVTGRSPARGDPGELRLYAAIAPEREG